MKKLVFFLIAFVLGVGAAAFTSTRSIPLPFHSQTTSVLPSDSITFTKNGDVFQLNSHGMKQITHDQHVTDTMPIGSNFLSVYKTTDYSSLLLFNAAGQLTTTFFDGNAQTIDAMLWASDPAVSPDGKQVAFVSDRDQKQLGAADPALFVQPIATGSAERIVDPLQRSGGIAHPVWNPQNAQQLIYDAYQYDTNTQEPFSVIYQYDFGTKKSTPLTTQQQNAFQAAFSPDGKQLLFLTRNGDNTVNLNLADIQNAQLQNIRTVATGDIAFPQFSFTSHRIYYLQAEKNSDYTLYLATLDDQNQHVLSVTPITDGTELSGSSSFSLTNTN